MCTTRQAELALTKGLSQSETHRIILGSPSQLSRSGDRVGWLSPPILQIHHRIEIIANILSTLFIFFLNFFLLLLLLLFGEKCAESQTGHSEIAGNLILERDTSDTSHVSFNGSKKKESNDPAGQFMPGIKWTGDETWENYPPEMLEGLLPPPWSRGIAKNSSITRIRWFRSLSTGNGQILNDCFPSFLFFYFSIERYGDRTHLFYRKFLKQFLCVRYRGIVIEVLRNRRISPFSRDNIVTSKFPWKEKLG